MARLHPDTFEVPTHEDLNKVGPGSGVLICAVDPAYVDVPSAGGERFWVLVTERNDNHLIGRVENVLVATDEHSVAYGDLVAFSVDDIYDIYNPQANERPSGGAS